MVVVGGCIGTDAHTVGIDAILNIKGFAGEKGLEYYRELKVVNLGAQVSVPQLVERAVEEKADAVLVSQVVTQRDAHLLNTREMSAAFREAFPPARRPLLVVGGPRFDEAMAADLGVDRVFTRGTTPGEVASYLVHRRRDRGRRPHEHSRRPEVGLRSTHRRYVSYAEAHYAGNLVDGAWGLGLFGDVATEMCIRTDGDEGLFASYTDVQFRAPVRAGDSSRRPPPSPASGRRSREMDFELRGGRPRGRVAVGFGGQDAGRADRGHDGDRDRRGPRTLSPKTGPAPACPARHAVNVKIWQLGVHLPVTYLTCDFAPSALVSGAVDTRLGILRQGRGVTPGRTSVACSTDAVSGHLAKMVSTVALGGSGTADSTGGHGGSEATSRQRLRSWHPARA